MSEQGRRVRRVAVLGGRPTLSQREAVWGCPTLSPVFGEDSLFPVKQFFLCGEVQENLSLLGGRDEFHRRKQAGAVIAGAGAEHAEDGVQHFTGSGHEGLEFGFVAGN